MNKYNVVMEMENATVVTEYEPVKGNQIAIKVSKH